MTIDTRPDWLIAFERDGFCVVPGVVSPDVCDEFCASAYGWLEGFPYGFKRDDRSTWTAEHMPFGFTGGLYNRYAVAHEDWMWRVRVCVTSPVRCVPC